MSALRQPILSLLGHVDHGKTTLLDRIAGSVRASQEAGGITQHIGAVEIPQETVLELCRGILPTENFRVPGLLIVDTPGHRSFETMRRRGGALADLAILVVDCREGVMPQTRESVQILKHEKTPFAVALTKIDLLPSWRKPTGPTPLKEALARSGPEFGKALDERLYAVAETLTDLGFSAERFDRVSDFTRNLGIVPVSSKSGVGVPELLALLVGLAQRFLESELARTTERAEATILERSEQKGVGPVASVILYRGTLKVGDEFGFTGRAGPRESRVRGIYRPSPGKRARRTQGGHLDSLPEVQAAAGVYLSATGLEEALPGGLLKVIRGPQDREEVRELLAVESHPVTDFAESGVQLAADTLGGLEALAFECREAGIPIHGAEVGAVSRPMILRTASVKDPVHRAVFAFNVPVLPDAIPPGVENSVRVLQGEVMYRLLEEYSLWKEDRTKQLAEQRRGELAHPAKFQVLPGFVFRTSKPAIVGIKVLAGTLRPGVRLLRQDGSELGLLKSLQREGSSVREAAEGAELAASIDGAIVHRTLEEGDTVYVSVPESAVRTLRTGGLSEAEQTTLEEMIRIRRQTLGPFWGQ
ncbi:MAG: translation initiation factor IF-2 [Thermoplasmata archaeon]|nr:translation initiation factor IF-2 [Thermoplasmata archaeon]